jgi:nicotinamide-nucleotide amidase
LVLEFTINQYVDQLSQLLGPSIVALEDVSVESLIATALRQKGLKIATAESCTGGYIAHLLTSMAGSSDYFNGSVVAYSNEVKKEVLGVAADDLETYGAVSAQVVEQMAIGVRRLLKADVAIATSGIAGPGGGSDEKPVGTVWIAVASEHQVVAKEFRFGALREQNIHRSAQAGLLMLRNVI